MKKGGTCALMATTLRAAIVVTLPAAYKGTVDNFQNHIEIDRKHVASWNKKYDVDIFS